MNRRESLKTIGLTTIGTGLLLGGCTTDGNKPLSIVQKRIPEIAPVYRNSRKRDCKNSIVSRPSLMNTKDLP